MASTEFLRVRSLVVDAASRQNALLQSLDLRFPSSDACISTFQEVCDRAEHHRAERHLAINILEQCFHRICAHDSSIGPVGKDYSDSAKRWFEISGSELCKRFLQRIDHEIKTRHKSAPSPTDSATFIQLHAEVAGEVALTFQEDPTEFARLNAENSDRTDCEFLDGMHRMSSYLRAHAIALQCSERGNTSTVDFPEICPNISYRNESSEGKQSLFKGSYLPPGETPTKDMIGFDTLAAYTTMLQLLTLQHLFETDSPEYRSYNDADKIVLTALFLRFNPNEARQPDELKQGLARLLTLFNLVRDKEYPIALTKFDPYEVSIIWFSLLRTLADLEYKLTQDKEGQKGVATLEERKIFITTEVQPSLFANVDSLLSEAPFPRVEDPEEATELVNSVRRGFSRLRLSPTPERGTLVWHSELKLPQTN